MKSTGIFRRRKKKTSSFDPTTKDIAEALVKFRKKGGVIKKEESCFAENAGRYQSKSQATIADMLDY